MEEVIIEAPKCDFYLKFTDVEALDAAHGVTPNSPSRVWL